MLRLIFPVIPFFLCLLLVSPAGADELLLVPLRLVNQSPVAALCGLPALGSARVLAPQRSELSAGLDIANNYTSAGNSRESLLFDGESYHWQVGYVRGLSRNWDAGVSLGYVDHHGGGLDGFIESWHNLFGLPQGGRDTAERNRLDYSYVRNGETQFDLTVPTGGVGDLRLYLGRQLMATPGRAISLRFSLELPTGNSRRLTGSGSWDAALWLSGEEAWRTTAHRFALFWGGGLLGSNAGDLLPEQRRKLAGLAHLGGAWSPCSWLILQLQLDAHSSLFKDSGLDEIDQASVQLGMGGQLSLWRQTHLELAVVEDLLVGTAPDVVFHVAIAHRF
jgi:hypothetical protein